jgi:hypothetical protein
MQALTSRITLQIALVQQLWSPNVQLPIDALSLPNFLADTPHRILHTSSPSNPILLQKTPLADTVGPADPTVRRNRRSQKVQWTRSRSVPALEYARSYVMHPVRQCRIVQ